MVRARVASSARADFIAVAWLSGITRPCTAPPPSGRRRSVPATRSLSSFTRCRSAYTRRLNAASRGHRQTDRSSVPLTRSWQRPSPRRRFQGSTVYARVRGGGPPQQLGDFLVGVVRRCGHGAGPRAPEDAGVNPSHERCKPIGPPLEHGVIRLGSGFPFEDPRRHRAPLKGRIGTASGRHGGHSGDRSPDLPRPQVTRLSTRKSVSHRHHAPPGVAHSVREAHHASGGRPCRYHPFSPARGGLSSSANPGRCSQCRNSVIEVAGHVDAHTLPDFVERLDAGVNAAEHGLIVDLSRVTFLAYARSKPSWRRIGVLEARGWTSFWLAVPDAWSMRLLSLALTCGSTASRPRSVHSRHARTAVGGPRSGSATRSWWRQRGERHAGARPGAAAGRGGKAVVNHGPSRSSGTWTTSLGPWC